MWTCSGLDSSSSSYCVRMLHNLSREGRTIICTIHQPSAAIYEMFDQVYVLAQGQCVYKGAAANTLSYLGENGLQCPLYHSMADFCKCSRISHSHCHLFSETHNYIWPCSLFSLQWSKWQTVNMVISYNNCQRQQIGRTLISLKNR